MTAISQRIVAEAMEWQGTLYRHQASRKHVGCDCLGLVRGVWRAVYGRDVTQPGPYTPDWAEAGGDDALVEAARAHCIERDDLNGEAGDLVLFRWRAHLPAKHAGILVSPDSFIHAYQGHSVTVSPLVPQWRRRIAGIYRFPEFCRSFD